MPIIDQIRVRLRMLSTQEGGFLDSSYGMIATYRNLKTACFHRIVIRYRGKAPVYDSPFFVFGIELMVRVVVFLPNVVFLA